MTKADKWLLPDGVQELLPEQAAAIESLRRKLLDAYISWGYELISPPMFEFLESLHVGTGNDLALQTFTLTDQLSGRLMGLRADITPQAARMDAHSLKRSAPARLCYSGTVLHSRSAELAAARELDQIGIELFGSGAVEADIEVIQLMLHTVKIAGAFKKVQKKDVVKVDLGHVGIFRAVVLWAKLDKAQESMLCDILQRKARPELQQFVNSEIVNLEAATLLTILPTLCGDEKVLATAKKLFTSVSDKAIAKALLQTIVDLKSVQNNISKQFPEVTCYFDLGELRGYDYHTGLVFAVYKTGYPQALAKGGRYDAIGKSFGRARPATGFSSDLRVLSRLQNRDSGKNAIFVPVCKLDEKNFPGLQKKVAQLRAKGEVLIQSLGNDKKDLQKERCDRELYFDGDWKIKSF
jgi:ATP phosphoribosyltransferase regulatory subunit